MLVICSGKPTDNLEDFFLGHGRAGDRAQRCRSPTAPDLDRLAVLTARTGIELV